MLRADVLEVPDVILVSSSQQEVTLVSKILEPAAVDKLDHVPNCVEVDVLDIDLVALALPHVVLEHGAEHGGPGAQNGLERNIVKFMSNEEKDFGPCDIPISCSRT